MRRDSSPALAPDEALPAEFVALALAARAAAAVAGQAEAWSAGVRSQVLRTLDAAAGAVTVSRARVVSAERDAGTWALAGDRNLAGFVGRVSRQGRGAGFAVVGQASTLEALPAVADAMVDGGVTPQHVTEITRATQASPKLAAELATAQGQARLVELAERLDGREFGIVLKQMSASLDPAARQRDHDAQRANRYLNLAHGADGTHVKGLLDTVSGHKLQKVLDALNPRPAKDDERTGAQRRADALMAMVHRTATDKTITPGAVAPVQVLVTLSEETWAALRAAGGETGTGGLGSGGDEFAAEPGRAPVVGSAADVVRRMRGVAPVADETGQAWPASEIARALCDCALTRAVLGATTRPLNLGHDERFFTKAQWLALYASGVRTCAVDGCTMPLRYSELHHIAWWKDHAGRTDLLNCAPECVFHHGEVHRLGLTIARRADGTYEHRYPDGRLYGGSPPDVQRSQGDARDECRHQSGPPYERGPDGDPPPEEQGRRRNGRVGDSVAGGGAVRAGAEQLERVLDVAEAVLARRRADPGLEVGALDLDRAAAPAADEMVVVTGLPLAAPEQRLTARGAQGVQVAGGGHRAERPVHGGESDVVAAAGEQPVDLLRAAELTQVGEEVADRRALPCGALPDRHR